MSRFWTEFFQILGTDLRLSTAFHPQTDGQSEVTIRVLENFFWPYVELHPHTWSKRLSVAEFAANNAINVSTGYTPFYLNAGEDLALPENLLVLPGSTSNQAVQEAIGQDEGSTRRRETQLGQGTREDEDSSGQDQERGRVEGR